MALADDLALRDMSDTGMWIWAGILTVVGLAASFGIAIWWQRSRDKKKDA